MRRFHVHISVQDISASAAFYTRLFGPPATVKADYVKWMLDDPQLNFAISMRGQAVGVNHLGLQLDSDEELHALTAQLEEAELAGKPATEGHCCYSVSNKYWLTDPQGIAWETYHTLSSAPTYDGHAPSCGSSEVACCNPASAQQHVSPATGCCASESGLGS